jgi:hypothetical protein
LIAASEFARSKTGHYFGEHLAEVLQARSKRDFRKDVTGDAIRKKGEFLQRECPKIHLFMLNHVRTACGLPESQDGLEGEAKQRSKSLKKPKDRL